MENIECNSKDVKVYCRFRPINVEEAKFSSNSSVRYIDSKSFQILDTLFYSNQDNLNLYDPHATNQDDDKNRGHIESIGQMFSFDRVFEDSATQKEVFQRVGQPIIDSIIKGFNSCLIAYGQTASGKTYTMVGSPKGNDGLIPRICQGIFAGLNYKAKQNEIREFVLSLSAIEIYLEKMKDLLGGDGLVQLKLKIRERKTSESSVENLSRKKVASLKEVLEIIDIAQQKRETSQTFMNSLSSRSHCIFILEVLQHGCGDLKEIVKSKLFLVDLAGSEKLDKTNAKGKQLEEARNINKSLSTLGNVINVLSRKYRAGIRDPSAATAIHVPYRNSKLTRLLQSCLGGNSKTTVVLCCSPSSFNYEETVSTLRFGARMKCVKNSAKLNTELSRSQLKELLERAQGEIETLKKCIGDQIKNIPSPKAGVQDLETFPMTRGQVRGLQKRSASFTESSLSLTKLGRLDRFRKFDFGVGSTTIERRAMENLARNGSNITSTSENNDESVSSSSEPPVHLYNPQYDDRRLSRVTNYSAQGTTSALGVQCDLEHYASLNHPVGHDQLLNLTQQNLSLKLQNDALEKQNIRLLTEVHHENDIVASAQISQAITTNEQLGMMFEEVLFLRAAMKKGYRQELENLVLKERLIRSQVKILEYQRQLPILEQDVRKAKHTHKHLESKSSIHTETIQELRGQIDELKISGITSREKIIGLSDQVSELQERLAESQKYHVIINHKLKLKSKDLDSVHTHLEMETKAREGLMIELAQKNRIISTFESRLAKLNRDTLNPKLNVECTVLSVGHAQSSDLPIPIETQEFSCDSDKIWNELPTRESGQSLFPTEDQQNQSEPYQDAAIEVFQQFECSELNSKSIARPTMFQKLKLEPQKNWFNERKRRDVLFTGVGLKDVLAKAETDPQNTTAKDAAYFYSNQKFSASHNFNHREV